MKRHHPPIPGEPNAEFVCDHPEKPIGEGIWAYDCDYCRIKVMAAIANGELDGQTQAEIDEIVKEYELVASLTPEELAERRSNPRKVHRWYPGHNQIRLGKM